MKKHLTPELRQAIIARYDAKTETIDQLAQEFNVPRYTVSAYAKRKGLTRGTIDYWSEREIEILINNWHKGREYCAKRLKRTINAVNLKAKRLGLQGCVRGSEFLTANNVANILNVDRHAVIRWIKRGLLQSKPAPINRVTHLISVADLEQFLKGNQDLWDSRKMKSSLWLTEPEWVKTKKRKDRTRPVKECQKWTRTEDLRAISMFKTGKYTYKQIGEAMGRSRESVSRRLYRLDVWGDGKYIGEGATR